MDCTQLYRDIAELTEQREKLRGKLERMNESMEGKGEMKTMMAEAEELENMVLEKYLDDFAEKNSELFDWQVVERVRLPDDAFIKTVAQLPDGDVLMGMSSGKLCGYGRDEDGKWKLKETVIDCIGEYDDDYGRSINVITELADGGVMIGGGEGRLYEYRQDEHGEWKLGEQIDGLVNSDGIKSEIFAMAQLPDGGVLVGGEWGVLYECKRDENGEWGLKMVNGNDLKGYDAVRAMAKMPDGGILIGGRRGMLRECRLGASGEWELKEQNDRLTFESERYTVQVSAIAEMPDEGMLIGTTEGALYEYRQGLNGEWGVVDVTDNPENDPMAIANIEYIMQVADNEMLIGGASDMLYKYVRGENGEWRLKKLHDTYENDDNDIDSFDKHYGATQLSNGDVLLGGEYVIDYYDDYADRAVLCELGKPARTAETLKENLDKLAEGEVR